MCVIPCATSVNNWIVRDARTLAPSCCSRFLRQQVTHTRVATGGAPEVAMQFPPLLDHLCYNARRLLAHTQQPHHIPVWWDIEHCLRTIRQTPSAVVYTHLGFLHQFLRVASHQLLDSAVQRRPWTTSPQSGSPHDSESPSTQQALSSSPTVGSEHLPSTSCSHSSLL